MTEKEAQAVAEALGGETWQSGGDVWLVLFRRSDGKVAVVSDESVCEYDSEESALAGRPSIALALH